MIPEPANQAADSARASSGIGEVSSMSGPAATDGVAPPILWGREEDEAIIRPQDRLRYFRERSGLAQTEIGQVAICCHNLKLFQDIIKRTNAQPVPAWLMIQNPQEYPHAFEYDGEKVALACLSVGAPIAAMRLEGLIAAGVKHFIIFGSAGGLDCSLDTGDFVIAREAIRDEGVSYHYLRPSRTVSGSASVLGLIEKACEHNSVKPTLGTTWTTDAIFRETVSKVQKYQAEGVLTVEMEAAALYAISKVRGVQAGYLLFVSDCIGELAWRPGFPHEALAQSQEKAIDIVLEAARHLLHQNSQEDS